MRLYSTITDVNGNELKSEVVFVTNAKKSAEVDGRCKLFVVYLVAAY